MPFAPDYSDFLRMKRIQKTIDVDSRIDARKTRSTYAFGAYNPTYKIGYLPPNLFLPGRLYPSPAPPGPPPSDTFYEFATVGVATTGSSILVGFGLENEGSITKIDFGDGTVETIASGEYINHTYDDRGSFNIRLSNPSNINQVVCTSELLNTLDLKHYSALLELNVTKSSKLTRVSNIPASLNTLIISETAVISIDIPSSSQLVRISANNATSLATINGIGNATNLNELDISGIAITECDELKSLFDALPTVASPNTGLVIYTNSVPCTTGDTDPDSIEALAIAKNWSFLALLKPIT